MQKGKLNAYYNNNTQIPVNHMYLKISTAINYLYLYLFIFHMSPSLFRDVSELWTRRSKGITKWITFVSSQTQLWCICLLKSPRQGNSNKQKVGNSNRYPQKNDYVRHEKWKTFPTVSRNSLYCSMERNHF